MTILFDLDGTLVDPGPGMTRSIQHALAGLGREVPAADSLVRYIGPPLHGSFAEMLGTSDPAVIERAVALYRERYVGGGMFEAAPYPGVAEGLAALRARGHRLFVATSKPHVFARRILSHFGLETCFEAVHGAELSGANQDKSALLREVLAREVLGTDGTWMVGDRVYDVAGARANGLGSIGVLWGYGSADELRAAAPDRLAATMPELVDSFD